MDMRKKLIFLMFIFFVFVLVACTEDPVDTNPTETNEVITYQITFETNGGSVITALTVDENTQPTLPANPTKESYEFDGWYLDEALTISYVLSPITSNITLYAKWSLIPSMEVSVDLIDEMVVNNHIHSHLFIDYAFDDENDELSFIQQLAETIYLEYFDQINGDLYYLTLYIYDEDLVTVLDTYSYQINQSLTQPGLTLID